MTEAEFNRLAAEGYNRIPVTLETFADLDTPLSIYLKLANDPYSYLLESVQGGERFGRYSFIGLAAGTRIAVVEGAIMVLSGNRVAERRDHSNPMSFISEFMARFKVPDLPGPAALLRRPGGCLRLRHGALRRTKTVDDQQARRRRHGRRARHPAAAVGRNRHRRQPLRQADPGGVCRAGLSRRLEADPGAAQGTAGRLRAPVAIPDDVRAPSAPAVSEFGEEAFKAAVRRAKQYIVDGDIMQVVLSQRMKKPFSASPMALYRACAR
jgi:anthranilate synthase component 1